MADAETLELVRRRRAAKLAAQPAPTEAPKGLRPQPAGAPKDKPSAAGSFFRGLYQGAAQGFGDELIGTTGAIMRPLMGRVAGVEPAFQEDFGDAYTEERNRARADFASDAKENPLAFGGGQLAGAVAVPAPALKGATLARKIGKGALVGAGFGALQGVGGAAELADVPEEAAIGAGAGGAIGAAFPAAAAGIRAAREAAPAVREGIAKVSDKIVRAAEANPVARGGVGLASGGASEGLIGAARMGQKMRPPAAPSPASAAPDWLMGVADDIGTVPNQPTDALKRAMASVAGDTPTRPVDASMLDLEPAKRIVKGSEWADPAAVDAEIARLMRKPEVALPKSRRVMPPIPQDLPTMKPEGVRMADLEVTAGMRAPPAPPAAAAPDALSRARAALGDPSVSPDAPTVVRKAPEAPTEVRSQILPEEVMPLSRTRPFESGAQLAKLRRESGKYGSGPHDDAFDEAFGASMFDEFGNEQPSPAMREMWRQAGNRMQAPAEGGPASVAGMLDEDIAALQSRGTPTKGGLLGTSQYFGKRNQVLRQQSGDPSLPDPMRESADALLRSSRTAPEGQTQAIRKATPAPPASKFIEPGAARTPAEQSFLLEDFRASMATGDPQAVLMALRKASMMGVPRAEAMALAKQAGWSDDWMRWGGLIDAPSMAPAPMPAPNIEPSAAPGVFDEPSFVRKTAKEMGLKGRDEKPTEWYRAEGEEPVTGARVLRENLAATKIPRKRSDVLRAILQENGIADYDSSKADAAYEMWKAGGRRGPKPSANLGGALDSFGSEKRLSSVLEGVEFELRGARSWADVEKALPRIADALGVEKLRLPSSVYDDTASGASSVIRKKGSKKPIAIKKKDR